MNRDEFQARERKMERDQHLADIARDAQDCCPDCGGPLDYNDECLWVVRQREKQEELEKEE